MDKIKVLVFLPRWANGGMERAAINIVKNSRHKEFDYTFLVGNYEENYGLDELKQLGIELIPLQKFADYHFTAVLMNLERYLSVHNYDVFHCHINNAIGLIFAYIGRRHNIKVIAAHTHNNAFGEGNLIVKNILRRAALLFFKNTPDLYFACSEKAGDWTFGKRAGNTGRYQVVYNGVDAKRFVFSIESRKNLRKKYNLESCFVIGHAGHFNYQKNQRFLIQILPMLLKKIPDVHLFMIGVGETKEQIKETAERHKLINHITIIETVTDIENYYAMFDALALPSHFEGFGMVAVEAQYCGLPVVCSEQVPRATDLSGKTFYLPIEGKEAEELWVNAFVQIKKNPAEDRTAVSNTEKFDNCKIAGMIEDSYVKMWKMRGVKA